MSDLDALLAGIVAHPHEAVRWLIVADWLDDHGFAERAELLRLHRMLIDTCCEPDQHSDRVAWQARIVELIDQGVKPCVPQHTLMLPGGVPLVGNFIPPGSFLMGGTEYGDEQAVHRVTLTNGLFVGIHPVTQVQWRAVTGENPSDTQGDDWRPVETIGWDAAANFSRAVVALVGHPVRLPTEAEWEYACRAGTTTHYHWGDIPSLKRMNYDGALSWNGSEVGEPDVEGPEVVGAFASNPWGLYDCHGNVWECCADWYDAEYYGRSSSEDPACREPGLRQHAARGGAWDSDPRHCRSANRGWYYSGYLDNSLGLRVVFTLT